MNSANGVDQFEGAAPSRLGQGQATMPTASSTAGNVVDDETRCAHFLRTLIHLAEKQKHDKAVEMRQLIQRTVFGSTSPVDFVRELQTVLGSAAKKELLPFIRHALPALRQSIRSGRLEIEGLGTAEEYEAELGAAVASQKQERGYDLQTIPITHDWKAGHQASQQQNDGVMRVVNLPDRWEVGFEAQYFKPEEIEVMVVGEYLLVHCKHGRGDEQSSLSCEVSRSYKLPADLDIASIKAHLSQSGVLLVTAEKRK